MKTDGYSRRRRSSPWGFQSKTLCSWVMWWVEERLHKVYESVLDLDEMRCG